MNSLKTLAACAALCALAAAAPAAAATYTEAFEDALPAWESRWFGVNSDAKSCYANPADRGNNPDGLWIAGAGQGCSSSPVTVNFDAGFAATLTSFQFDVASYLSDSLLTIFDASGATLLSTVVTPTFGGTSEPGVYVTYGVTSTTGIGGFSFTSAAAGNTSIDNLVANGESVGGVPEPATWAMMILGFGSAGAILRRRRLAAA